MEMKMKRYAAHTTRGKVATHKNSFPKKATKTKLIAKVSSLGDLRFKAERDPQYLQLAICGAENLGGQVRLPREKAEPGDTDYMIALNDAMRVLNMNANETGSESGVVDEVNFVRDCVK
jgi:hypothetical protein